MTKEYTGIIVKNAISDLTNIGADNIAAGDKLADDLALDSLDRVELTMNLENELDVSIEDDDAYEWTTVQSVIDYAFEKVSDK